MRNVQMGSVLKRPSYRIIAESYRVQFDKTHQVIGGFVHVFWLCPCLKSNADGYRKPVEETQQKHLYYFVTLLWNLMNKL